MKIVRTFLGSRIDFDFKFLVSLHGEYNTSLALWKHHVNLSLQSFRPVSLRIESFAIINLRGVSTKLS